MARSNPLADPDFAKNVALSFIEGKTRQQMCDEFGVKDLDTITRWRRDPRVKVHAQKYTEDRILQVTRRVDGKIQHKLDNEDLTVQELIMIRKEFLGGQLRQQTEKADDETIMQAADWVDQNPDILQAFLDSVDNVKSS